MLVVEVKGHNVGQFDVICQTVVKNVSQTSESIPKPVGQFLIMCLAHMYLMTSSTRDRTPWSSRPIPEIGCLSLYALQHDMKNDRRLGLFGLVIMHFSNQRSILKFK